MTKLIIDWQWQADLLGILCGTLFAKQGLLEDEGRPPLAHQSGAVGQIKLLIPEALQHSSLVLRVILVAHAVPIITLKRWSKSLNPKN